ncbi:unnamed protein product [Plutella xylostella]|uniref:E3 ubiquitin-protein ligase n=1 Tax=Plutella xylostella TaxID=51655 RepID=A0A8S4D1L7_PLUXY|nr:unnamed protein product [Plutella xylostella]
MAAISKKAAAAAALPECPVCMEAMCAPIFQCKVGHSLCHTCTSNLRPPVCPICREDMTQMRNWQLEEILNKAQVPCPNKSRGCIYVTKTVDVEDHLKECIFRSMDCPLGVVFGKCSWNGQLKEMMDHFSQRHPENCNVTSDAEVVLKNINIKEDDRFVYLLAQGKLVFIMTVKLDTLQNMAYWTVQHIGSKKAAQQHVYEIHLTSQQDTRRKVVFTDHCFNDAIKADEVFRMGKCAILPLETFAHFVKDKKIGFRFFIKKMPFAPKSNKENKPDENKSNEGNQNKPNSKGPGPNAGPKPKGPGPNPTGSGPKPKGTEPNQKGPNAKGTKAAKA